MKSLREILTFAVVVVALFVVGCDKSDNTEGAAKQNTTTVTYYTIDGVWQLTKWNGVALTEGTLLYIDLDRKDHRFEMWDNLNSMYPTMRSGSFLLSKDDMQRDVISGWYDYGVGDWDRNYFVELNVDGDTMVWSAVSGDETMTFVEVDELPVF